MSNLTADQKKRNVHSVSGFKISSVHKLTENGQWNGWFFELRDGKNKVPKFIHFGDETAVKLQFRALRESIESLGQTWISRLDVEKPWLEEEWVGFLQNLNVRCEVCTINEKNVGGYFVTAIRPLTNTERVIEYVQNLETFTAANVEDYLLLDRKKIRSIIDNLVKSGRAIRVGTGTYRAANKDVENVEKLPDTGVMQHLIARMEKIEKTNQSLQKQIEYLTETIKQLTQSPPKMVEKSQTADQLNAATPQDIQVDQQQKSEQPVQKATVNLIKPSGVADSLWYSLDDEDRLLMVQKHEAKAKEEEEWFATLQKQEAQT